MDSRPRNNSPTITLGSMVINKRDTANNIWDTVSNTWGTLNNTWEMPRNKQETLSNLRSNNLLQGKELQLLVDTVADARYAIF
jgi:hypothetical protein